MNDEQLIQRIKDVCTAINIDFNVLPPFVDMGINATYSYAEIKTAVRDMYSDIQTEINQALQYEDTQQYWDEDRF